MFAIIRKFMVSVRRTGTFLVYIYLYIYIYIYIYYFILLRRAQVEQGKRSPY